jgi:3-hydroxypropanoate dehydrogenase
MTAARQFPASAQSRGNRGGLAHLLRATEPTVAWADRAIDRRTLDELHALASLCPASAPQAPAALLFVTSEAGKARLLSHAPLRQRHRVLLAPACALVAYDPGFAEHLVAAAAPQLGRVSVREAARRTAALQGPYMVLAARSLGLDAAPLEDLDLDGVTREFFGGGRNVATSAFALGYPIEA